MIIHCFGDSWTHGIGVELAPGNGSISAEERYDKNWDVEREKYSWPGHLNKLLTKKYLVKNYGCAGYNNFQIYHDIIHNLQNYVIKKDDLVIVAFSSIIREPLNFLTLSGDSLGFVNYSNACHVGNSVKTNDNFLYPNWIVQIEDKVFQNAAINMYMDFLANRFDTKILYQIAMNYIVNLQILFESMGIKYLFVNAFENIISKDIAFYNLINKENWVLFEYTLSEYLLDRKDEIDESLPYSLWQDDVKNPPKCSDGPHPNRIGYKFIAELFVKEIEKRKIL